MIGFLIEHLGDELAELPGIMGTDSGIGFPHHFHDEPVSGLSIEGDSQVAEFIGDAA